MSSIKRVSVLFLLALCTIFALHSADPAHASCTICTPVSPVPSSRWGSLEPTSILADSSFYQFNFQPNCSVPFYFDLAVGQNVLFAATGTSLQYYDLSSDPGEPPELQDSCNPTLGGWKETDTDFYIKTLAVVPGDDSMVGASIIGGMGFVIIDTSNPAVPRTMYQDEGSLFGAVINGTRTRGARINNRNYAFLRTSARDMLVYDMTFAVGLSQPCREGTNDSIVCPGVYKGKWSFPIFSSFEAAENRLLVNQANNGLELYDTSQPVSPVQIGTFPGLYQGSEIWKQGSTFYAAVGKGQTVDIYSLPAFNLVTTLQTPGGPKSNGLLTNVSRINASNDAGKPYLHVAHSGVPGAGPQREYIFDMTNINVPTELTPTTAPNGDGYWGWYYEENSTGFNHISPQGAVVAKGHIYRSAWSLLDVHALSGPQAPTAGFLVNPSSGPYFGGDTIVLSDASLGGPTSLSWQWCQSGSCQSITGGNVSQVNFVLPVAPTVSYALPVTLRLTASNAVGTDTVDQNITLMDPSPVIGDVLANGSAGAINAFQCETVEFEGIGLAGRDDPLTNAWVLRRNGSLVPGNYGTATTASFQIGGTIPAGRSIPSLLHIGERHRVGKHVEPSGHRGISAADLVDQQCWLRSQHHRRHRRLQRDRHGRGHSGIGRGAMVRATPTLSRARVERRLTATLRRRST